MQNAQHKRSTGPALVITAAVIVILAGAGVMLYPKITDWRYELAQSSLAAQAAEAQAALAPV
jgi:hypothetical protein